MSGIFYGDGIAGLASLEEHSVDMLLTDPPYGTTENDWDTPIDLDAFWAAVHHAVKPNGAICIFAQCPYNIMLGASNLDMLRYEWIWDKGVATGFLNANRMPLKVTENVLVFYRHLPTYNPQWEWRTPYVYRRCQHSSNYRPVERTVTVNTDGRRYPTNLIALHRQMCPPPEGYERHPTQKTVDVCAYLIRTYTDRGQTVADTCAGTGTTAVAAIQEGREYLCWECDAHWYEQAKQRIESALSNRQTSFEDVLGQDLI